MKEVRKNQKDRVRTSVAALNMVAVSASSTKNVLCPAKILSDAPTRVNILSTGVITHRSAGT